MAPGCQSSDVSYAAEPHDGRGWSMRRGHCKRLKSACASDTRKIGRAYFARTVNTRSRWKIDIWDKRHNIEADLRWALRDDLTCSDEQEGSDDEYPDAVVYNWEYDHSSSWHFWYAENGKHSQCNELEYSVIQFCDADLQSECSTDVPSVRSLEQATPDRCMACCLEDNTREPECVCTFGGRSSTPWELAVARANRIATETYGTYVKPPASEVPTFEALCNSFLNTHRQHILDSLSPVIGQTQLAPAPLAPAVQHAFMNMCKFGAGHLPAELIPVFHGTRVSNHASIFSRGLLVPDGRNGVRVAHGSVHGRGIYATIGSSVSWSCSFAPESCILVCGLLQHDNPSIMKTQPWGRVVFDSRRIVPLFIASGPRGLCPFRVDASTGANRVIQQSAPVTSPVVNAPRRQARVLHAAGAARFLSRRAARKRR